VNDSQGADASARPRFSLMALLTFILVVAILLGWWTDRHRLQLKVETQIQAARFGKLKLFEHLRRPEVIGRDISEFPEVPALADDTSDDSMVPLLWDRVAPDRDGKECIGYYFQTGELEEGQRGFYVLTLDGKIVAVEAQILVW